MLIYTTTTTALDQVYLQSGNPNNHILRWRDPASHLVQPATHAIVRFASAGIVTNHDRRRILVITMRHGAERFDSGGVPNLDLRRHARARRDGPVREVGAQGGGPRIVAVIPLDEPRYQGRLADVRIAQYDYLDFGLGDLDMWHIAVVVCLFNSQLHLGRIGRVEEERVISGV